MDERANRYNGREIVKKEVFSLVNNRFTGEAHLFTGIKLSE